MNHENYSYKSNGVKNNVHYYICSSPNVSCKATLKRKSDGTIVLGNKLHTHDPGNNFEKTNFRKSLVGRAVSETTLLRIIYDEEAIRNPNAASMYPWPTAEASMRKARRTNVPVLPATLRALGELLDERQNLVQCNDHQFYQTCIVDDYGKCSVMFACPEIINAVMLNGATELHADATFKVVPSMPKCRQLFMIHMILQNHSIPICYVLMESKTQEAYQKVLNHFKTIFPNVQPLTIMTDFEIGLKNAFSNAYPNASLFSCWFHYVQSLWKNIKRLNYVDYLRGNETARMCLKMVMVLALLPINEIELGFQDIKNHARTHNVNLTRFFNYFTNYWLIQTGPDLFSVFNQPRRTNNNVESFHGRMKDKFQVCHPNLWKMLGHLSDCSKGQHIVINQLDRGMQVTRNTKNKYILNSKRIKMATDKLTLGLITRREFLIQCSHVVDGYLSREGNWARFVEAVDDIIEDPPMEQIPIVGEIEVDGVQNQVVQELEPQHVEAIGEIDPEDPTENSSDNTWDESDFFVPEDLALVQWQEEFGNDEEDVTIPYVPVGQNPQVIQEEGNICVVCRDNERTHALVPCGHKVICEDCVSQLVNDRCPMCNTTFTIAIRIWD